MKSCKFAGVMERRDARQERTMILGAARDFGMIQILNYNASHEEEERWRERERERERRAATEDNMQKRGLKSNYR